MSGRGYAARAMVACAFIVLASCGAGAGGNNGAADAQADAARERPQRTACDDSIDPQRVALDELIRIVPDRHPSFYYVLAARLFEAGRRDEATFWFYAGQLRYRTRLACHPGLAPDTEPALFGSLQEAVGRQINEHAAGDPRAWTAAMARALAWDEATHNGFEPKAPCRAAIAEQRRGLGELIRHVRTNETQLRRERATNGLPNR